MGLNQRTNGQESSDTFYSADKPLFQFHLHAGCFPEEALVAPSGDYLCALGAGKEVNEVDDSVFVNVSGLKNTGRR